MLSRDTSGWAAKEAIVLAECHPWQRDLVADPGRRVCALVGRGGGKTTAMRARFVLRMLRTRKAKCLYIATTREQALLLMWEPLKQLVAKLGIEARWNETSLRCTFKKNGASIRLVGADNMKHIEKLRGLPHHEVWIDEAASYPAKLLDHLLKRVIGPRLGDFGGMLGLGGTPGHHLAGPFYDATKPGSDRHRRWSDRELPEFAGWVGWSFHSWTLKDGAEYVPALKGLWEEALIEKAENGWSDQNPVWRREYLGEWAADDTENVFKYRPHLEDGTPWNQWDPPRDKLRFAELPRGRTDWQFVYGMDLGYSDPFAIVIFAFSPTDPTKTLYQVYEFEARQLYAKPIAELLTGEEYVARVLTQTRAPNEKPGGLIGRTGWPIGLVADRDGSGDALLAELANVYGIPIEPADKKNYHDSIELTNGDLVDGRMKALKGSVLETQMIHGQWGIDEFGRLKKYKGQRDDHTDAAIYARRKAQHLLAAAAPRPPAIFPPALTKRDAEHTKSRGEFEGLLEDDGYYSGDDAWGN